MGGVFVLYMCTLCLSGLVDNLVHPASAVVVSSILVETIICVLSSVTESVRT